MKGPRVITLADYFPESYKKGQKQLDLLTSASEVNSIAAARGGSEVKVKITSDSGAAASVLPAELLRQQVGTSAGGAEGTLYAAAGPTSRPIRNVGQRILRGMTEQGARLQLPFEAVENITKPLASVSKMVDAGQAVLYHPGGSAIYDLNDSRNKELKVILAGVTESSKYSRIPLKRENDVYNFELLVDMPASQEANRAVAGAGFGRPR